MTEKIISISKQLYSIGLIATAVLMPLDLITQGDLVVEWFVIFLLAQRLITAVIFQKPFVRQVLNVIKSALPFVLPALAAIVTTFFAVNRSVALVFLFVLISLIGRGWLISYFTTKNDLALFEKATLIMTAILVAFGYFQFIGDIIGIPPTITAMLSQYRSFTAFPFPRVHSLSLEPLYFSNYLLLPLSILVIRLRQFPKKVNLWKYQILLVASLALLISSVSRSAILGLLVSGLIYVLTLRKEKAYIIRLSLLGLASLAVVGLLVLSVKVLPRIEFKAKAESAFSIFGTHITNLNEGSAQTRYELWPKALKLFSDRPLIGVGLNGSRGALHPDDAKNKNYDSLQPINNDYLTILSEQGLLGILCLVPILILLGRIAIKTVMNKYSDLAAPYVLCAIAIAVQINSFGGLALLRTWVVIGLMVAAWRLSQDNKKPKELI